MNTKDIKKSLDNSIVNKDDVVEQIAAAGELAKDKEIAKEILKYGSVPVRYVPTRAMLRKPQEPGLIQLIGNAMTEKEVINLLKNGKDKYKNASAGTIRKWDKASDRRIAELSSNK